MHHSCVIHASLLHHSSVQGKTGESLVAIAERKDRELGTAGQGRDVLMRHGDYLQPPIDTATSLYSLTYGAKQMGEPGVQVSRAAEAPRIYGFDSDSLLSQEEQGFIGSR
jgi:hypothetical protein